MEVPEQSMNCVNQYPDSSSELTDVKGEEEEERRRRQQRKKGKKRLQTETELWRQRASANVRERERTRQLNEAFGALRGLVPVMPADKMSKIHTLRLATDYIRFLDQLNRQDTMFNYELLQECNDTRNSPVTLGILFNMWRGSGVAPRCSSRLILDAADLFYNTEQSLPIDSEQNSIHWWSTNETATKTTLISDFTEPKQELAYNSAYYDVVRCE